MPPKAILLTQGRDGRVRLDVNGCRLVLTATVYYAGLATGKAELRAAKQAEREAERQAAAAAGLLAWIDEDTGGKL